jgi:hypothetical protein
LSSRDWFSFRLQAKIRKLEVDLAQIDLQMGGPRTAATANKDDKEMIDSLNSQVTKLKSQNSALHKKVEEVTDALDKKKRELQLVKKTAYLGKSRGSTSGGRHQPDNQDMELEVLPGRNPSPDLTLGRSAVRSMAGTGTPLKANMVTTSTTMTPVAPPTTHHPHDDSLLQIAQKQKSRFVFLLDS